MSRHEKAKSSFDKFTEYLTSTKRKHNKYNGSAARPVSANENENDDFEIDSRVLQFTTEELNREIRKLVEDYNIPKDKQEPLFQKTLEDKRDMLRLHYKSEKGN